MSKKVDKNDDEIFIKKEPKEYKEKTKSLDCSDFIDTKLLKKRKSKIEKSEKDIPRKKVKKEKNHVKEESTHKKSRKNGESTQNNDLQIWKWWEEDELKPGDAEWISFSHNGPMFPPPYKRLPESVKLYYDGKPVELSELTEENATHYAKMLNSPYTKKDIFNKNFFVSWRKFMTKDEQKLFQHFEKCDFTQIYQYYDKLSEEKKSLSKEEKKKLKEEKQAQESKYNICFVDGHAEKISNFIVEPPGLFRGRGDHPKQGMIKPRIQPEDITLNLSEDAEIPKPPPGHQWKNILHLHANIWTSHWICPHLKTRKYIHLNPTSRNRGRRDMEKYDLARGLRTCIDDIRRNYTEGMSSGDIKIRQRSVALYFIDRLALRAGHEKEEGETADTVGCCSLRLEHITLRKDDTGCHVDFDFLGKDSIRYMNSVQIPKKVFKNLRVFMKGKKPDDNLFDRLKTSKLNNYLRTLMPGLTAKVFRTYNASSTLQDQLDKLTNPNDSVFEKVLSYNRANRAVAILCNHQRAVSQGFDKSKENLIEKIKNKKASLKQLKKEYKSLKKEKNTTKMEKKKKQYARAKEQLHRLKCTLSTKEENKEISLGTSKTNYLDPRITVAWCKKYDIPFEKVYPKTLILRFQWAVHTADSEFRF